MTINICLFIVPALSVVITSTGNPTEGQNYSLKCTINGIESLNVSNIEYQWNKGGNNISSSSTLYFTPLTLDDNGTYTCNVTITSSLLNNTHTAINGRTLTVSRKLKR